MDGRRALLLINRHSRQGADAFARVEERLRQRGFEIVLPETDSPADFSDAIREHEWEVDLVVVGGGDGTIRCALSGAIDANLPIGIIPLGTANNLARNLQIPSDLDAAIDVLISGEFRVVDVADVNGVFFLNVAGIGMSVEVNRTVPRETKKRWGVLAYIAYAFKTLRRLRPFHAQIASGARTVQTRTMQITVCNGRHFGSGLTIREDATIDDGFLDLVCIEAIEWWNGLKLLPALISGKRGRHRELKRLRAREFTIFTRHPHAVDTDGEVLTRTPARFRVHQEALRIFGPPLASSEKVDAIPSATATVEAVIEGGI